MTIELSLQARIRSDFGRFYDENNFIDCELSSGETKYKAYRIMLTYFFGWFKNYFQDHPPQERVVKVDLPCDPDGMFQQVLEILLGKTIHLTTSNVSQFLLIGKYYDSPMIKTLGQIYLKQFLNEKNVLTITKTLISLGLIEETKEYAPMIAKIFMREFNFSRKKVLDSSCPQLLAEMLKDEQCNSLTMKDKIQVICEFMEGKEELTDNNDRKALESVIDWTTGESFKLYLIYPCDWLSFPTSRRLINKVLDLRRQSIIPMEKEVQTSVASICRWYPFSWFHHIQYAKGSTQSPEIDSINFISTLGVLDKMIDAQKFGLLQLVATESFTSFYLPANIFVENRYYLSVDATTNPTINPSFSISYGNNTYFQPTSISVNSDLPRKNTEQGRAYPRILQVNCCTSGGAIADSITQIEFSKSIAKQAIQSPAPIMSVKMTMPQNAYNSSGRQMLRINTIDIKGRFLPC